MDSIIGKNPWDDMKSKFFPDAPVSYPTMYHEVPKGSHNNLASYIELNMNVFFPNLKHNSITLNTNIHAQTVFYLRKYKRMGKQVCLGDLSYIWNQGH